MPIWNRPLQRPCIRNNDRAEGPVHIGWVGGLTRSDSHLSRIAADAGHRLEHHTGDVKGHGADRLRRLVERSSVIVVLMTVNSHKGVMLAKRTARKFNRPVFVMQRCNQEKFRSLLTSMKDRTIEGNH